MSEQNPTDQNEPTPENADSIPNAPDTFTDADHALRTKRRAIAILTGSSAPEEADESLLETLEWMPVLRGEILFQQDECVDGLYIVVDGALDLIRTRGAELKPAKERVSDGEFLGASALLAGEPHYATVRAVRDCDVCRLRNEAFAQLCQQRPDILWRVAQQTVQRLQPGATAVTHSRRATVVMIASLGDVTATDATGFAQRLTADLQKYGEARTIGAADAAALLGVETGQPLEDHVDSYAFVDWLQAQAEQYRYLLYVADPAHPRWTQRCIEQTDRILLLGHAGADPAPGAVEAIMAAMPNPDLLPPQELVLLHQSRNHNPADTFDWLKVRSVVRHHHVALDTGFGMDRVSRFLRGRAIALVLGGGGMRAAAGVGALRVLEDMGVRADVVGGTSAGSIAAAFYATGVDTTELQRTLSQRLMRKDIWLDPTLPLVAAMRGHRLVRAYHDVFGDVKMEDLWTTPFTISGNLTEAKMVVHRTGPLHHAVRASTSIAGIFPPALTDDGELLIDGGVFNNTPADVARLMVGTGPVIAVDLGFTERPDVDYGYGEWLNGFRVLWSRINPLGKGIDTPSIVGIMMRANALGSINTTVFQTAQADLILRPPVGSYGLFDFDAYDTIVEAGYEYAKEEIAKWVDAGGLDGV